MLNSILNFEQFLNQVSTRSKYLYMKNERTLSAYIPLFAFHNETFLWEIILLQSYDNNAANVKNKHIKRNNEILFLSVFSSRLSKISYNSWFVAESTYKFITISKLNAKLRYLVDTWIVKKLKDIRNVISFGLRKFPEWIEECSRGAPLPKHSKCHKNE